MSNVFFFFLETPKNGAGEVLALVCNSVLHCVDHWAADTTVNEVSVKKNKEQWRKSKAVQKHRGSRTAGGERRGQRGFVQRGRLGGHAVNLMESRPSVMQHKQTGRGPDASRPCGRRKSSERVAAQSTSLL